MYIALYKSLFQAKIARDFFQFQHIFNKKCKVYPLVIVTISQQMFVKNWCAYLIYFQKMDIIKELDNNVQVGE